MHSGTYALTLGAAFCNDGCLARCSDARIAGTLTGRRRKRHIGVAGFEPATTRSQSECATRLRYTPQVPTRLRCRHRPICNHLFAREQGKRHGAGLHGDHATRIIMGQGSVLRQPDTPISPLHPSVSVQIGDYPPGVLSRPNLVGQIPHPRPGCARHLSVLPLALQASSLLLYLETTQGRI